MAGKFTGQLIADKYRVEGSIVLSGLGELYRGTNVLLEKPISIAVLPAELSSDEHIAFRFLTDARVLAKLNHPNILNLTDFGTDPNGIAYAVYEAAKGETLREAIEREGQLPVEMAVEIAKQTGSALAAAHEFGAIHRNLNTSNIVAANDASGAVSVKVFGFNTPNAIDDSLPDARPERFAYLAPEQCAGADMPDARGDIYSLGVILFEMLAGSQPFTGTTPTDVMMRHIEEPPPPLSAFRQDLPAALEPVVIKALAKDPDARYQTAAEFIDDLLIAASGQPL
ncbi:MAG TPA: serine/threonine-protein kinase, partial [Pyrinomonadaceae bacterium]|nr:serine/threonine-protein kinase [Pyrinomonadaceae bacterium]